MPWRRLVDFYKRYELPLSSASLLGGFVFDALTLRRADAFWENFWIIVHLLVVGGVILILNREQEREPGRGAELNFWLVNLLQFTFGGLLSAFLVFYFRSGSISVSWPFILLLAAAFAANERLKRHYSRLAFQLGFFFLSIFSFAAFIVPVLVGAIGPAVFVLSGAVSLAAMWGYAKLLGRVSADPSIRRRPELVLTVLGVFVLFNLSYFSHVIPPLPLSLKDGGIYHSLSRDGAGDYLLGAEKQPFWSYLTNPTLHLGPEEGSLIAFTAIFAPSRLSPEIVHEWQYKSGGEWHTASRVALRVSGGREEGFRTYSISRVMPGKWRVSVETSGGLVLGRINFDVAEADKSLVIRTERH